MKKIICAVMSIVLLLPLAACSDSGNTSSNFSQTQIQSVTTDTLINEKEDLIQTHTQSASTDPLTDPDNTIEQTEESQQHLEAANRSEIIMVKATIGSKYNFTIYAVDPETGDESTVSEFSIPASVTSNADGSIWYTYPMFGIEYTSKKLPLSRMFSTDYKYIATTRYSAETMEFRAGFYKEGEGLYYTDVTKSIGAVGGDFDDPAVQLALGFTDDNELIFADLPQAPGLLFSYNTENWTFSQVDVSDNGKVSSLQSCNDIESFLMQGDNWSWLNENWELTDWIDDTHCLINYPEESAKLLYGETRIDRWGIRIYDLEAKETTSFIPGESRSNWSGVISPDGGSVAFLSAPANGTGDAALYVTSLDGGEPMKILDNIPSERRYASTCNLTRPVTYNNTDKATVYFLLDWRKPVQ